MDLLTLSLFGGAAAEGGAAGGTNPMSLIMIVGMVALMYFMVLRPQKKRQKEEQEMRDSIQIGDEIVTIGGIMGRVVTVKDDSIVIETGTDRTKIKFLKSAIQTNQTANDRMAAEKKAAGDELYAVIIEAVGAENVTAEDVLASIEGEDLTVAKVRARLSQAVKNGVLVKESVKIDGKAKR